MIIRLTKANFSSNNIGQYTTEPGTLTFNVSPSNASWTLTCAAMSPSTKTGTGNTTWANIPAGSTVSYEVSLSGYNTQKGSISIYGNTSKTITLSEVGSVTPPVTPEPDQPGTTTNYTFTINPTPSTATVTLTASGYTQSGNSISVASGTSVSWEVSANGYDTIKGTHTITENKTLDVEITDLTNAEKIDTTEENVVVGKWITVEKGTEKDLASWRTTNFVEIPSGATHVYSNDITLYRLAGNNTTPYGFYDNEQNYVSGIPLDVYPVGVQVPPGAAGKWRGVLKWPIPEGVKYVRVCWTYPGSGYVHELTGIKTATVASPDVYFLKNN